MAFKKKTWVDRMVEYAGRRRITNVSTKESQIVDVERAEGIVSSEGSAFSAANMNDMEQRVADAFGEINRDMDGCKLERREDGPYLIYTPVGGADPVAVPLGKPKLIHDGSNDSVAYELVVDCTTLPNYKSLTPDNFLYEVISLGSGGYDWGSTGVKIQKTYDSATGKLTIKTGVNNLNTDKAYVNSKGNVYYVV